MHTHPSLHYLNIPFTCLFDRLEVHSHNMQSSVKISILHQVKHYIALYYACIFDSRVRQQP